MAATAASPLGLYRSVRQLGAGLLDCAFERFELFCIELQEEKFRLLQALILINAAVVCGLLALVFLSFTLVFAFQGRARFFALCGVSVFYLLACAAVVLALRRNLRRQKVLLPETRRELAEDRKCIPPRN